MSALALIAAYANPLIVVDSADFDGANDYMSTAGDPNGSSDGKSGTLSFFMRVDGGDGNFRWILRNRAATNPASLRVAISTDNTLTVAAANAAGTTILALASSTAYAAAADWLLVQASWDLANGLGVLYVNGVDDLAGSPTLTDDTIDYTNGVCTIGADSDGFLKFNGCLAELWFAQNVYTDFSNPYYRQRWASIGNKPGYVGATGNYPNGTAPIFYQHLDNGEAVANFAVNAGTGGDFSITGTLETGSTSPSD